MRDAVRARLRLVHLDEVLHHAVVEVLAAEVRVARGREHLEDAVLDREQRHVERAAAEVVHDDFRLLACLAEPVGERGSGGLR